jgi:hypothetical protein
MTALYGFKRLARSVLLVSYDVEQRFVIYHVDSVADYDNGIVKTSSLL